MREWSKQLVKWATRPRAAKKEKEFGTPQVQSPYGFATDSVPEPTGIDVEAWLEEKAKELNGDWSLARLSGFSRGQNVVARQVAAALLRPTEELWVEPAPEDLYSGSAMRVRTLEGTMVGYLEPSVAETASRQIREGVLVRCFVYKVTLNDKKLPSSILVALMSWALSPASTQ